MISLPAGAHIWIAAGVTDLPRGFTGLSAVAQTALQQDPFAGHVFVFRGRRGDLIKLLRWDGDGRNVDASSGRRPRAGRYHLLERSYRCYSRGLAGASRHAHGSRRWLSNNSNKSNKNCSSLSGLKAFLIEE